ncbi:MFS general substrate transporter [Hesseltinella vesiculosa]|uniref:MFS-type drug efflux transporter P55 n=1 Tax=Hesseltinella vesiculosa TaxID=101127 RepID=A0A1X2GKA9_9FUNG|nr:MFS general substrate transporter [Hesseltinella vesiculosa]
MGMFMTSLNTTVVAPAMSIIATQLNALDQQTWIATAYLVAFNAIQPISGKFSDIFGRKPILLFGTLMFFIGSLVNALATKMSVLIPGRTVQGVGGGCIMSMAFIIITDLTPPHLRPRFQSLLSVIYGLASCVGPLIGGAFVSNVNWNWDFWLNVILSAISFILIFFLLKEPVQLGNASLAAKLKRIDYLGTIFSVAFVCCILLALSWGPVYGWGSSHAIGPFVGAGVSLVSLIIVEGWVVKEPLLPGRIIFKPEITILYIYNICLGMSFIGTLYFGPVMFQSVFGADSMWSGIRLIPYMALLIVGSVGSANALYYFPYIKVYIVIGAAINVLGFGLFFTVNENSSFGQQVGYLTLCGLCFGLSMSNVILAVQGAAKREEMAIATGLTNFFMVLASGIGVAIYQVLMQVFLKHQFTLLDPSILAIAEEGGALKNYLFIRNLPDYAQEPLIHAYYQALHTVFIVPLAASGLSFICSLFIKNTKFAGAAAKRPAPQEKADQAA